MAFRFALAPILRLRQSIERQRTLGLQEANLRVSRAQQKLAELDRYLSDSAQADSAALAAAARPPNSSSLLYCVRICNASARNSSRTFASWNPAPEGAWQIPSGISGNARFSKPCVLASAACISRSSYAGSNKNSMPVICCNAGIIEIELEKLNREFEWPTFYRLVIAGLCPATLAASTRGNVPVSHAALSF